MREHGGLIIGGIQVATTLQCPHCGGHFVSQKGSGKRRAFCIRCKAITCGKHVCDVCIPIEAKLEHTEGSKTLYDDKIKELLQNGAVLL